MKIGLLTFVLVANSAFSFVAKAEAEDSRQKTNIIDQFTCSIRVDPTKVDPGYTATMKLSAVRDQWMNGTTLIQTPGNDLEANVQTASGLEIQLHYDYAFKNGGSGWSLYRCLSGYTKYKGQFTTWACPQMAFVVPAINGIPQFDQYNKIDQEIEANNQVIGDLSCVRNQTLVTTKIRK